MFRILLKALREHDLEDKDHYNNLINKIRNITNSTNKERDILIGLCYMRNCFHNNGVHTNSDLPIEINGVSYEFKKGKQVPYSIDKVFVIIEKSLEIVGEWLRKEPMASLDKVVSSR